MRNLRSPRLSPFPFPLSAFYFLLSPQRRSELRSTPSPPRTARRAVAPSQRGRGLGEVSISSFAFIPVYSRLKISCMVTKNLRKRRTL